MNDLQLASFVEKYEVNVAEEWRVGTEPSAEYAQECFYRSYMYLCDNRHVASMDDVYLVHGECTLSLGPHAWVELPGDVMFDGVRQRFYRTLALKPACWYKYTPRASHLLAANMPGKETCCYAFYLPLKLPWGDPAKPLVIDSDRALEYLVSSGLRPDLAKYVGKRNKTKR